MAVVWKHDASPNGYLLNPPRYRILLENAKDLEIRMDDGLSAPVFNKGTEAHALYRLGLWMAEILRPNLHSNPDCSRIELTVSSSALPKARLNVRLNRKAESVNITRLESSPETKRFRDVSLITIASNEIRVEGEELPTAPDAQNVRADADTRRMKEELSRTKAALAAAERELSAQKAALAKAEQERSTRQAAHEKTQNALSSERAAHEKTQEALASAKRDLEAERRYNARLRITADTRLEELLTSLKENNARLDQALKDKLSEAETLSEKAREAEKALSDKTAEAERLNNALENSVALLELKTLDCEQARQTLDSLRERNLSNEDTLELMREEPFLKGNSVRKTLETVELELDAAENGLGRIIRLREKINDAVKTAILAGNGALPLSEELGGNRNGGSRPTPGQSSENGTGFERGREPTGASAAGD